MSKELEQALNIVQAAADKASLPKSDHVLVQQCMEMIKAALVPKEEAKEEVQAE